MNASKTELMKFIMLTTWVGVDWEQMTVNCTMSEKNTLTHSNVSGSMRWPTFSRSTMDLRRFF